MTEAQPLYVKSDIPPGRSGDWVIERFSIADSDRQDPGLPHWARREPGSYTRLKCGNEVFMTDLYDEWWTQRAAAIEACKRGGEMLITGLGLGLVAESVLSPPTSPVEKVTAVELSHEVIRLSGRYLSARYGSRIEIIQDSAFSYQPPPGHRFSVIWHDIWPNPHAGDALSESDQLCRRYQRFCDWQGSWPIEYRAAETAHRLKAGLDR